MKLGERNFILNFSKLNNDEPYSFYLFRRCPRPKKAIRNVFASGLFVAICLLAIVGKIAIEAYFEQ